LAEPKLMFRQQFRHANLLYLQPEDPPRGQKAVLGAGETIQ
jgi:hypothetical protein